jgi:hypothetical protein
VAIPRGHRFAIEWSCRPEYAGCGSRQDKSEGAVCMTRVDGIPSDLGPRGAL